MGKIGLIIKREYGTRVRKKSFILMTILGPLLMAAVFVGAIWISTQEGGVQKVIVVDTTPGSLFHYQLKNTDNILFDYRKTDLSDKEFKESDYTLLLYLNEKVFEVNSGDIFFKKVPSFKVQNYISGELEEAMENYKLFKNDISKETYAHINTKFTIFTRDIDKKDVNNYITELSVVGFAFAMMIYMFIFIYGVQVMRGVIEEKTSRIVEVLVSSVKPFQLMMGKIVGIGLVGLTQFCLWMVLTSGLILVAQKTVLSKQMGAKAVLEQQLEKNVIADATLQQEGILGEDAEYIFGLIDRINFPFMIGMFLFYFLGGFLLYSALFAAVGAAVDSETDTQQFMMPITLPLIFALLVGEFAVTNPDGPAAFWFSIFPLTSPIVMMLRVAVGFDSGSIWQLYLSMALLIGAFITTVWLASKIYRTGILMYGKKPTYRELFKWLFIKD
jgi:ABC-2 type transport system permease protein